MKITLIQPPRPSYHAISEKHWQLTRPFSLFFLASAIEKYTTFEVQILDLEQKKNKNVPQEELFRNNDSQIFGITATTFTRFEAIQIAKHIKATYPDSWVIMGGCHFMYCAEDTLTRVPEIDVVVRGEGEKAIVELANGINDRQDFSNIRGITYRKNREIVRNADQSLFENLDDLPFYSEFTWDEYPEYLFSNRDPIRATSVMTSRGCPNRCIFCSKAGMKYRVRNPLKIVQELLYMKEQFGIEGINFLDLTFTADPQHVKAVCQEMINWKLDLKWWCESRVNIPLNLLETMKQAGCTNIAIGVESGSPKILKMINKNISPEQVVRFCEKCRDMSIKVDAMFMFSFPDETVDDVRQSVDLLFKLEELGANCHIQPTQIFPGTELERIAFTKGLLRKDFSWCEYFYSNLNVALGQMANIPLFMDTFRPRTMKKIQKEVMMRHTIETAVSMKFRDLLARGLNSIVRLDYSARYALSPKFYYQYLRNIVKSR